MAVKNCPQGLKGTPFLPNSATCGLAEKTVSRQLNMEVKNMEVGSEDEGEGDEEVLKCIKESE